MGRLIDADKLSADMYHEAFVKDSDMQKWDSGCWIRYKMFENVLKAQPAVQPEQRWIPCSVRLPEESRKYLVTVFDGIGKRTTSAPYHRRSKSWTFTGRMAYWKVIAWMPLPEPARLEND